MFEYDSITVSYARELTSVSMRYSQGDGFNTSLPGFMYCTHEYYVRSFLDVSIRDSASCVWLSSVARSFATWDDSNKDNVWTPTI